MEDQAPPQVDWRLQGDNRYVATYKGKEWHLYLEEGTAIPDGWRLWLFGRTTARPVAAKGRPLEFVLQQATHMVAAR